ncbi:phosphatidylinositol-glycan biosynthesis class X protein-like [Sycon ciliatum]|uniref:phosphatidylinositol-glycan biosynthesis class X protein-like n=1 Tax=Sycon ciliatum TaxID=27933 RepID=UPI0031F6279D
MHTANMWLSLRECVFVMLLLDIVCVNGGDGVASSSSDVMVRVSQWSWKATGAGLHRKLAITADLDVGQSSLALLHTKSPPPSPGHAEAGRTGSSDSGVFVRLLFTIPSTMYMDMDELAGLAHWHGFTARTRTAIDVEKPAHDSTEHQVAVFLPIAQSASQLDTSEASATVNITLPIHLRYQAPSSHHQYANATIAVPELHLFVSAQNIVLPLSSGCSRVDSADVWSSLDGSNGLLCPVSLMSPDNQHAAASITLQVPVGIAQHESMVAAATVLVTGVVCVLLVWRIYVTAAQTTRAGAHEHHD